MAVHTVSTEVGTFTRTSHRTYTHAVVFCGEREDHLLARQARWLAFHEAQLAEYRDVVAGRRAPESCCTMDDYRRWVAEGEETLRRGPEMLALEAKHNREAIAGNFGQCFGWSMSARNAGKMAAQAVERGHAGVRIIEVTERHASRISPIRYETR